MKMKACLWRVRIPRSLLKMISSEERPAGHSLKSAAVTGHIVIHIVCSAAEEVVIATGRSVVSDVH